MFAKIMQELDPVISFTLTVVAATIAGATMGNATGSLPAGLVVYLLTLGAIWVCEDLTIVPHGKDEADEQ